MVSPPLKGSSRCRRLSKTHNKVPSEAPHCERSAIEAGFTSTILSPLRLAQPAWCRQVHRPQGTKSSISRMKHFGGTAVKTSVWGWVLLCTLSAATLSFGQIANTSLRGVIKDPSGALVPGATVALTDSASGKTFSTTAGSTGLYTFAQLFPSKYNIKVSAPWLRRAKPRRQNCW